jgi:hypothetical protein
MEILNFPANTKLILEDHEENTTMDLTLQSSYTFFSSTTDDPARFSLHFLMNPASTIELTDNLDVVIYESNNTIWLKRQDSKMLNGEFMICDILGRQIVAEHIAGVQKHECNILQKGIMLVTYFDSESRNEYRQKVIIK